MFHFPQGVKVFLWGCGGSESLRGIDKTDWIRIDRATYDACLDRRNYRPRTPR